MSRLLIEHLPRIAATYEATPVGYDSAKSWINQGDFTSLIRTTELIAALDAGMGIVVTQADLPVTLLPGDEALFISLSFGVLLAWAEGGIPPLPEDWRCVLLIVKGASDGVPQSALKVALTEEVSPGGVI